MFRSTKSYRRFCPGQLSFYYLGVLIFRYIKMIYHHCEERYVNCVFVIVFIIFRSEIGQINWAAPTIAFPKITELLNLQSYRKALMLGLIVSVGGLTESIVRDFTLNLIHSYLQRFLKTFIFSSKFMFYTKLVLKV